MQAYKHEIENLAMEQTGMEFFLHSRQKYGVRGTKSHIHDAIELIYMINGKFWVEVNSRGYSVGAGDLILFRSNAIHSMAFLEGMNNEGNYYVLKIKPSFLYELASRQYAAGYVLRFLADRDGDKTFWGARELENSPIKQAMERLACLPRTDYPCRDLALKLAAAEVILAILQDMIRLENHSERTATVGGGAEEQICQAVRYVYQHYADSGLDAGVCSRAVGMSYSHFSRCFGQVMRKSFRDYLNRVRLNYAERLLETTDQSITQIAFACGYNSTSYFIKTFRRKKGKTPFEARRKT